MRHRKRGRRLGRSSSHRKAMLRNLASSLFLTEREILDGEANPPRHPGRVVTTLQKAKEVRSLVEKCITIARKSLSDEEKADEFATSADRNTDEWRHWRKSHDWWKWCAARAPVVAAQRQAMRLLGDRHAVHILFDKIAPRFRDRHGGYTRVLRLAEVRLGDAGEQAVLEFVGQHDRITERSAKPEFDAEEVDAALDEVAEDEIQDESADKSAEDAVADPTAEDPTAEESAPDDAGDEDVAEDDAKK